MSSYYDDYTGEKLSYDSITSAMDYDLAKNGFRIIKWWEQDYFVKDLTPVSRIKVDKLHVDAFELAIHEFTEGHESVIDVFNEVAGAPLHKTLRQYVFRAHKHKIVDNELYRHILPVFQALQGMCLDPVIMGFGDYHDYSSKKPERAEQFAKQLNAARRLGLPFTRDNMDAIVAETEKDYDLPMDAMRMSKGVKELYRLATGLEIPNSREDYYDGQYSEEFDDYIEGEGSGRGNIVSKGF